MLTKKLLRAHPPLPTKTSMILRPSAVLDGLETVEELPLVTLRVMSASGRLKKIFTCQNKTTSTKSRNSLRAIQRKNKKRPDDELNYY